jgi:threonine dehydrogenase-like Zn-dependent dehydrogenase
MTARIVTEADPSFETEFPVAIIGAGAAGLVAALACHAAGVEPLHGIAVEVGLSAFEARAAASEGVDWSGADWDALALLLADLHRAGVSAFFDAGVAPDDHNASGTALYLSQSTLLLPSKEYYEGAKDEAARAAAVASSSPAISRMRFFIRALRVLQATPPSLSRPTPSLSLP